MAVKISSLSKEYVKVQIEAEKDGDQYNPTSDTVEFAFKDFTGDADPESGDWAGGAWETDFGPPDVYYAKAMVGPGSSNVLAVGKYFVWVRITDSPEIPVRRVGVLTVE